MESFNLIMREGTTQIKYNYHVFNFYHHSNPKTCASYGHDVCSADKPQLLLKMRTISCSKRSNNSVM